MSRVLTGIQCSGKVHLGNILGAIKPALELSQKQTPEPSFFFIADLHSFTSLKDTVKINEFAQNVAAAWLACGLDIEKDVFYRQSDLPEVTELTWYLGCHTPYPMLANAHAFKDKSEMLSDINAGLFYYPVLMAADILLYDAHIVPVGKDQKQHLEITRDIANTFNRIHGETFIVPEAAIREEIMTIPGTDGRKMSKSYNNYIDIFASEKEIKKAVMSIITDSTPLEEPKNPDTCNVFKLFQLVASPERIEEMRSRYLNGNFGYGNAKQWLFEVLLENFKVERNRFQELMQHPDAIKSALDVGTKKAKKVAQEVLARVRSKLWY